MIIQIFAYIFGNPGWYTFVYCMQIIVSFISVYFFYKLLKLLIKNEYIAVIITFMYGISTAVIGWNTDILTESLALSITIFFAYFIISYIKLGKLKYGIFSIILALIITFLKPACIIYPIILFTKEKQKETKLSLKYGKSSNQEYFNFLINKEKEIIKNIPKTKFILRYNHLKEIANIKKILKERKLDY